MGALMDEDGNGKRSTEDEDLNDIASNPVVYQLVRVDVDGRLIPATDAELIDVKHFVEDDGTRQSENVEVDSKKNVFKMDVDVPLLIQPSASDDPAKNQSTDGCSEFGKKTVNEVAEGSFSENYSSLKPDFSLLEGEICLDDFSIRELQKAFRATFGRYTSVKDKLWLKRRIAMGLTNSCDIPSTNFIIKDYKMVLSNVKEETTSRTQSNMSYPGLIMMNKSIDSQNETSEEALSGTASNRIEEQQALSTKRPEKIPEKCNEDNLNTHVEQCGSKRIRRPTRRYIEEHSEVEVTECSGRLASLRKNAVQDQHSLKSKIRTHFTVDTSQDLLGGYDARIPSVLRVRRRPPRKDFLAFVNFAHMERQEVNPGVLNSEQLPREKFISSGVAAFNENDGTTVQPVEASVKRKHHRAWTLGEVLKLVEGVSRYGAGRWSQIRQVAFASSSHRTSVDLKDKWRNLLKASFTKVPTDKGTGNIRKPASLPIPIPILLRVRELADKGSHSRIELGSSQFVGHGGIVQEKETGFL